MRVILDTNVLLNTLIKVDSIPYKVVQAWLDGRFELTSSTAQIDEISRGSRYPRVRSLIGPAEVGWLVNRIRQRARMVEHLPTLDISADPGDDFLLAMAQSGDVDCLVTGDKAGLLAVRRHRNTRIVSVTRFFVELER